MSVPKTQVVCLDEVVMVLLRRHGRESICVLTAQLGTGQLRQGTG